MKFTSEDLMKAMGLQVGDRIKVGTGIYRIIVRDGEEGIVITNENTGYYSGLEYLVDTEFEILPRPKRVGELKCGNNCDSCHIRAICNGGWYTTLYKILEYWKECDNFDQEIYDLLKARLDKEVSE